jgi:hypothetical protein
MNDRDAIEAVDGHSWYAFRIAMEQAIGGQIRARGQRRPSRKRLSDSLRPGD